MLASGVTYQQVFIERRLRREGYFVCLVHGFSASIHFSLQRRITASNLSTPQPSAQTLETGDLLWELTQTRMRGRMRRRMFMTCPILHGNGE